MCSGQSWGGMLGAEYGGDAAEGPEVADHRQFAGFDEAVGRGGQPAARRPAQADVQETLTQHEQAGTTDDPEYQEATMGSTSGMSAASCHSRPR